VHTHSNTRSYYSETVQECVEMQTLPNFDSFEKKKRRLHLYSKTKVKQSQQCVKNANLRAFAVAHFFDEVVLPAATLLARLGDPKQNVVVQAAFGPRREGVDLARVRVVVGVVAQHFVPFAHQFRRLEVGKGRRRVVVERRRVLS